MVDIPPGLTDSIRERLARVAETIADAARKGGRSREPVRLVVVTKTQPPEIVRAAIEAGARILGENYAEEAAEKIETLRPTLLAVTGAGRGSAVEWHMIGHVQSRKAKLIPPYFALVHSVDSLKLAERLNHVSAELKRQLPVLLEFNVGGESAKHGWPASSEKLWPKLLPEIQLVADLPNLVLRGLMTMPPLSTDPESARSYFRSLRRLRDFLAAKVPRADWRELSMGTSTDYRVAVEEGATLVRVGQAILGPRPAFDE
jgi:PLP dependent protein